MIFSSYLVICILSIVLHLLLTVLFDSSMRISNTLPLQFNFKHFVKVRWLGRQLRLVQQHRRLNSTQKGRSDPNFNNTEDLRKIKALIFQRGTRHNLNVNQKQSRLLIVNNGYNGNNNLNISILSTYNILFEFKIK